MVQRKLLAGITTLGLVGGGGAVAVAATSAPQHTTINAVTSTVVKINRFIQDGTRWQNDVYNVKSGGTITVVNLSASDGPHTFSVVKKSDLPKTTKQINNCQICGTIAHEHGANPQSQAPPQFPFVENGTRHHDRPECRPARRLGLHRSHPKGEGDAEGDGQGRNDALLHLRRPSLDAGEAGRRQVSRARRCYEA